MRNYVTLIAVLAAIAALTLGFPRMGLSQVPASIGWPTDHQQIRIATRHGDDWPFAKGCDGRWKRHVGADIMNRAGRPVYATWTGRVVMVGFDTTWGYWITIEHGGVLPSGVFGPPYPWTSQYWHVNPQVRIGQVVNQGQQIATVYDLGSNSHLHFGLRRGPYSNVSNRGALPATTSCGPSDPKWPENTLDPLNYTRP